VHGKPQRWRCSGRARPAILAAPANPWNIPGVDRVFLTWQRCRLPGSHLARKGAGEGSGCPARSPSTEGWHSVGVERTGPDA
jgi:hypothetical protein